MQVLILKVKLSKSKIEEENIKLASYSSTIAMNAYDFQNDNNLNLIQYYADKVNLYLIFILLLD